MLVCSQILRAGFYPPHSLSLLDWNAAPHENAPLKMDPETTQQPLYKMHNHLKMQEICRRGDGLQRYLIGILIQHYHNLGHVVQLTDHFQVVHGPLPLLIFGLLQNHSTQAADMKMKLKSMVNKMMCVQSQFWIWNIIGPVQRKFSHGVYSIRWLTSQRAP